MKTSQKYKYKPTHPAPKKVWRFRLQVLWPPSSRILMIGFIVLAFAIGGVVALRNSFAATNSVGVEAEDGIVTGNAGAGSTNGASGDASVKFGGGSTPNPNPPGPAPTPPNPADLLFKGDYETGDFSQFENCQNTYLNSDCTEVDLNKYSQTIVTDIVRQGQYAARYEVRDGDVPDFGGGERSEVSDNAGGGREGDDFWYQWSTYFTANFPHKSWGVVSQWHDNSNNSPPLSFDTLGNGTWGLTTNGNRDLWEHSQDPGTWQDIKIHIIWSSDPSVGTIELWHNGVRQTFTGGSGCDSDVCHINTLGAGGIYFKQGIYRDASNTATGVLYHDGFSAAKSEAGLVPLD